MYKLMNTLGEKKIPFLFILDFDLKEPIVLPIEEIDNNIIKFKIAGFKNYKTVNHIATKPTIEYSPIKKDIYKKLFDEVLDEQINGNNYLLNLTFSTKIQINSSLENIFHIAQSPYKLYLKNRFLVFSPETFIKIRDGHIFSYPMKGTIDASIKDAKEILSTNEKENYEHITIVDLIRNDLSQVVDNVTVERFKYLELVQTSNKNIFQMSSEIKGKLPKDYHKNIGDILYSLLPAGSITGAPKKKCIEIIKRIENHQRGFYTGVMGIFDGNNMDSAVMIRFIEKNNDNYCYKSGGGIRIDSNLEKEYQEIHDKIYLPIY
jgi:para-aminobenzoate synthetase component I